MTELEIEDAINRYNKRLDEFGVSEQALGWSKKGRAKLRYEILLSQWDFNDQCILDFGCGFGDMLACLNEKKMHNVSYTGVDINSNFIAIAKEKYHESANFLVSNILEDEMDNTFDFILSSGVFNHKLGNNMGFIKNCFHKFNQLCSKGFAVNFLSDKVDFTYDYTFHANPGDILNLAYQYSNNVVLRNDYMPFEFTIFVNKFSVIDKEYTVYNEYLKYV